MLTLILLVDPLQGPSLALHNLQLLLLDAILIPIEVIQRVLLLHFVGTGVHKQQLFVFVREGLPTGRQVRFQALFRDPE